MSLFSLLLLGPAAHASPSGCFGVVDFVADLEPTGFALLSQVDGPSGLSTVTVDLSLSNVGEGRFERAEVRPGPSALGVVPGSVRPARFGGSSNGLTIGASEPLQLTLPTTEVSTLMTGLASGAVPLVVHAEELPTPKPNVEIVRWRIDDDLVFRVPDGSPVPEPPFNALGPFGMELNYPFPDLTPFPQFDLSTTEVYVTPDPDVPLENIPRGLHYVRVTDMTVNDSNPNLIRVTLELMLTQEDDLTDIYSAASFCGTGAVDHPVGATRLPALDFATLPVEVRDQYTFPLRFNDLPVFDGRARLTGQIHGHALRPLLHARIRTNEPSRLSLGLSTDLSLSAQLRVDGTIGGDEAREDVSLYSMCFPVGDATFGAISLPMVLSLEQGLFADAELRANTVIDVSHRIEAGFAYDCTLSGGSTACTERGPTADENPLSFTPPQVVAGARGRAELGTTFDTDLYIGGLTYPECSTGARFGLSGEASARLDLDTDADPWWRLGHSVRFEGSVELEALGFGLIGESFDIVDFDTDDVRTSREAVADLASSARYLSGEDQRWMVAIDEPQNDLNTVGSVDVTRLPDGGAVLAITEAFVYRVLKVDRFGELAWSTGYSGALRYQPHEVVAMPDGGFVTGGSPAFLARHAADGSLLWASTWSLDDGGPADFGAVFTGLATLPVGPNRVDLVAVGQLNRSDIRDNDAIVVRLRDDGTVVWAKLYQRNGAEAAEGVTTTVDGDIVVAGSVDAGPDPVDLLAQQNGWLMRLDGDGNVEWSRGVFTSRAGIFFDVAEAASGELFAVGQASRTVLQSASAMVARMSAGGDHAVHALFVHDVASEIDQDWEVAPPVDASDGPYDRFAGIAAVDGSVVVVGESDTLGVGKTAWAAKLGPNLGAEWFAVLDGAGHDSFTGVAADPDGLYIAGYSRALSEAPPQSPLDHSAFVMKAPFSGAMRLHPSVSGLVLRHLVPGIRDAGAPEIVPEEIDVVQDAPVTVSDLVVGERVDVSGSLLVTVDECARLLTETGHPTTTDSCADPDLRPPLVRIVSPVPGELPVGGAIDVEVVLADESGVAASGVALDGSTIAADATIPLSDLGLGVHTVTAFAEDPDGQRSEDLVAFTVIDDVPPEIVVVSPEPRAYDGAVPVEIEARDVHSGPVALELTVDGASVPADTAALEGLAIGTHELVVEGVDGAGNRTSTAVTFETTSYVPPSGQDPAESGAEGCGCGSSPAAPWAGLLLLGLLRRRATARGGLRGPVGDGVSARSDG